jgi:hypothetical protein
VARLHLLTRAVFAVVAAIFGWTAFNASSAVVAAAPEAAVSAYAYNSHHPPVVTARTTTELGPPAAPEVHANYDAFGRRSHGTSVRSGAKAPRAATTYDTRPALVQVATATSTTRDPAQVADAGVVVFDRAGVAANGAIDIRPPLSMGSKQFGTKWGKHAADYGLDPASSSSRSWFMNRARDVHLNPSEVRRGAWNPAGGGGENYFFFRQGEDLLVTRPGGELVTMFPSGSTNAWFKNAEVFPH